MAKNDLVREPLLWYPTEDGTFRATWLDGRTAHELIIEPQLARTFSESRGDFIEQPWLAWTIASGDRWLTTWRTHWVMGDDYESPLFGLHQAMKAAERFRWEFAHRGKKHLLLRRLLGLERLALTRFEWWLERHYSRPREPHPVFARRVSPSQRNTAQWIRLVEAQAKKRLEQEGREPLVISDY